MIGEHFVEMCVKFVCSLDSKEKGNLKLIENIGYILRCYGKSLENTDYATEFIDKVNLLIYICSYRLSEGTNFNYDELIINLESGKFFNHVDYIKYKTVELSEDEINTFYQSVEKKKDVCDVVSNRTDIQQLLNDIETGNYNDEVEIFNRWNTEINKTWSNISQIRRRNTISSVSSLDMLNDNYDPVMDSIRDAYSNKNTISTGYKSVNKLFPNNGYEVTRLYVIGGTSGIGKSNFLVNLIRNAIIDKQEYDDDNDCYLYITGENLIRESLERFYCCFTGMPHTEMVQTVLNDPTFSLKSELVNKLTQKRSNVIMKYIKPIISTTEDIRILVEETLEKYNLKGVYVDYLDLFSSRERLQDLRLDLGQVCLELKEQAVEYSLPFISPTQLNRSGYDKECDPSLISMSESMKKVDHSDFVLYLQPGKETKLVLPVGGLSNQYKVVRMTVVKNRFGEIGDSTRLGLLERSNGSKVFNYRYEELPSVNYGGEDDSIPNFDLPEYCSANISNSSNNKGKKYKNWGSNF